MKKEYLEILDLPHYEPKHHPRMSLDARAAQFSPFAALTGFDDELDEAARRTERESEIGESDAQEIDCMLHLLSEKKREAAFTMFVPDAKKEGGSYRVVRGVIKRIDTVGKTVILQDGTTLPMAQLKKIE